jgi:hypothetical protein
VCKIRHPDREDEVVPAVELCLNVVAARSVRHSTKESALLTSAQAWRCAPTKPRRTDTRLLHRTHSRYVLLIPHLTGRPASRRVARRQDTIETCCSWEIARLPGQGTTVLQLLWRDIPGQLHNH